MRTPPVAFFVFNRPDLTRMVLDAILEAEPAHLLIVADGPREHVADDREQTRHVLEIIHQATRKLDVSFNVASVNMGGPHRILSGLDWVFTKVGHAIILEDDCVPSPTFFQFTAELLQRFANDQRVAQISGYNPAGKLMSPYSYIFSRYGLTWGWATWARAWHEFDRHLASWPSIRSSNYLGELTSGAGVTRRDVRNWTRIFDRTHSGTDYHWDYAWLYTCWTGSMLSIVPTSNLVRNVGFGPIGTHTVEADHPLARVPAYDVELPLVHPPFLMTDAAVDRAIYRSRWHVPLGERIKMKVRRLLGRYD